MKQWLGKGWDMTIQHKYIGMLLFAYRLLWGFLLFRLIDSLVTPVLARYPDLHPNADAVPLFWIEAEFRLLRTGLIDQLAWLLAGLLALRMVLTPLINAGIYHSFHHAGKGRGTRFLAGVRLAWKPMLLLYLLEKTLIAAPGLWILPKAKERLYAAGSVPEWLLSLLPYAAAWLVWGFAAHLLFQALQFGAASRQGLGEGVSRMFVRALPLIAVSLVLAGIGIGAALALSAVSLVWPGFIAILLHQGYHFIRTLLALWTAASQFEVWRGQES